MDACITYLLLLCTHDVFEAYLYSCLSETLHVLHLAMCVSSAYSFHSKLWSPQTMKAVAIMQSLQTAYSYAELQPRLHFI